MDLVKQLRSLLTEPKHTRWIAPCIILAEAVLCGLIIWKIPYTEIDYSTYLHQARKFLHGERNYEKIHGPSGPLVYPAIHLYIYSALYYLTTTSDPKIITTLKTDEALHIGLAQICFGCLYVLTLAVVLRCYRNVNAPPWLLACLVLSKRLHSIFLLRMFNDAWATFAFWVSILLFQKGQFAQTLGALVWSLGVGTKMTVLLAAPAVGIMLLQSLGLAGTVETGVICLVVHVIAAQPFLLAGYWKEYLAKAFEFGRVFLYKWTVNWRWVDEETFLSKEFAISLLIIHLSLLVLFLHWKWVRLSSRGLPDFVRKCVTGQIGASTQQGHTAKITPTFVMDAMLGSMVVGLLCARSLHYQFYAYLGWTTPYILWRAGGHPVWVVLNWAVQEYCWLVFPSTYWSSLIVVLELALQTVSLLIAPPVDHMSPPINSRKSK